MVIYLIYGNFYLNLILSTQANACRLATTSTTTTTNFPKTKTCWMWYSRAQNKAK